MGSSFDPDKAAVRYFSAMGNTEFAVRHFASALGIGDDKIQSIEDGERAAGDAVTDADTVIIAYPNYMCVIPKIMSDYLSTHRERFRGKKIIALVTYAMFLFDSDLLAGRLFGTWGVPVVMHSGIGVRMPIVVGDMRLMKPTEAGKAAMLREQAKAKLDACAAAILQGRSVHDGKNSQRLAAFLRQRMFYGRRIRNDFDKVKINKDCTQCGICVNCCPKNNFALTGGALLQKGKCTQCYRCVNLCPQRAITIWGKKVWWQYKRIEST